MTVLAYGIDDLFILRIIKYHVANPDRKWANSYELHAHAPGDDSTLNAVASAFVLFEQTIHNPLIIFDRYLLSTWEADSKPYNPASFISTPIGTAGTGPDVTNLIGLGQAFSVARVPSSGRFGHIFYRGVLTEDHVSAPAGKSILSSKPAMQTIIDEAVIESEVSTYFEEDNAVGIAFVMVSAGGDEWRNVRSLVATGVSNLPQDHAWFNRTPALPS
jgi:hypothetical protein